MRLFPLVILNTMASGLMATTVLSQPQPSNSSVFTGAPPVLVSAGSPNSFVDAIAARYFFTLQVPSNSRESVGKVTFSPQISQDPIQFNLANTTAFQGTQQDRGNSLAVQASQASDGTISVQFEPPVAPGTIFTISLLADQNPSLDGIYQFTVHSFPSAASATGLDLGVGRFTLDSGH